MNTIEQLDTVSRLLLRDAKADQVRLAAIDQQRNQILASRRAHIQALRDCGVSAPTIARELGVTKTTIGNCSRPRARGQVNVP